MNHRDWDNCFREAPTYHDHCWYYSDIQTQHQRLTHVSLKRVPRPLAYALHRMASLWRTQLSWQNINRESFKLMINCQRTVLVLVLVRAPHIAGRNSTNLVLVPE